tara:strand:+ start:2609 stop:2926 length:318 start_codon:yes stop_codon:yes gene_type:complete
MKIIRNIFLIMIVSLFIHSCEGFKLKKKSTSGEEFLIEKKDPLILPPNFSKLPKPKDDLEEKDNEEETIALDNVFSERDSNDTKQIDSESSQDSDLKESILEKIK